MEDKKISLLYDPQTASLKSKKQRKWLSILWSVLLLSQVLITIFRLNNLDELFDTGDIISTCLNLLVPIIGIAGLIYNSKASRELFVVFAQHEVRFRNRPGKKLTKIQHQDLRSVKQNTLSAEFRLHNGKQHHLNWENADYDDIQLIKQHLQTLKQQLERAGTPA